MHSDFDNNPKFFKLQNKDFITSQNETDDTSKNEEDESNSYVYAQRTSNDDSYALITIWKNGYSLNDSFTPLENEEYDNFLGMIRSGKLPDIIKEKDIQLVDKTDEMKV